MITAIIRNKENTLVLELPHSIYDIYEKLQSIGIMQPPKQIPLTDNEDEDIGVKLFSESDFGRHLLLTLHEKNTIADANMLTLVIGAASDDIKDELEQNILYDQYDTMDEVINAVRQMTQDAGPVKAVFFCPLIGNIDEGDGDLRPSSVRWMNWGTMSHGKSLTARISVSPNPESACILSDILEKDVPEKYYLSQTQMQRLLSNSLEAQRAIGSTRTRESALLSQAAPEASEEKPDSTM